MLGRRVVWDLPPLLWSPTETAGFGCHWCSLLLFCLVCSEKRNTLMEKKSKKSRCFLGLHFCKAGCWRRKVIFGKFYHQSVYHCYPARCSHISCFVFPDAVKRRRQIQLLKCNKFIYWNVISSFVIRLTSLNKYLNWFSDFLLSLHLCLWNSSF